MATSHALAVSVNDLYFYKFLCNGNIASLNGINGYRTKKRCENSSYHNGNVARISAVCRSWRLRAATDLRFVEESTGRHINVHSHVPSIEIPVTCYQILGIHDQAEKDEIVKSVMHLKNAEIEEGYTKDAVISRHNFLIDVRDKLLFEPEYAGMIKEKRPPKSSLRVPWDWLPAALCLLQEAGEDDLLLEIGRRALQNPDSKPFVHDMLLAMALAECDIAKVAFEKNYISQGFEALARAQCLLRSKISLGKMTLLSQIEESLEELAPACTLELLGMPHTPDNAERRLGAIAALRELLGQGLNLESSCQVQDWPCFLNQALKKLMASEIVDLIPWDNLAVTRKNRKSLESQNQRIVIDFNNFYMVFLGHIALGFSSKQFDLINKAKLICECLIASEGIDLKFEEAFCSFLLGQADEATAAERLRQLELNFNNSSQKLLQKKETKEVSSADKPLETWLQEAALSLFPDTRDSSPSLVDFFTSEKKTSGKRQNRIPITLSNVKQKPLAVTLPLYLKYEEPSSSKESSRHLGSAVKQPAPPNLQCPLIDGQAVGGSHGSSSTQMKRILGVNQGEVLNFSLFTSEILGRMVVYAAAIGCIMGALFTLKKSLFWRTRSGPRWRMDMHRIDTIFPIWSTDPSLDLRSAAIKKNENAIKLKKFFSILKMHSGNQSEDTNLETASISSGVTHSITSTHRQQMPFLDAEILVKRWQAIKAEALGPKHDDHALLEVLDGQMLVQWQGLADAARARSCFWRFVLLQMKIIRADILKDDAEREIAEIEVFLEEAAELVDTSQHLNPTYYSPYKILYLLKRQDDGSWRFHEGEILSTSQVTT